MTNKHQIWRANLLLVALLLGFGVLAARLVDLQVLCHDELSARAEQNTQHEFWIAPRRGDILDVNGNVLATSVSVKTVCADPSLIGNYQAVVAHALAPLLQTNEAYLINRLTPHLERDAKGEYTTNGLHYVRLAKNISEDNWQLIVAAMTNLNFGVNEATLSRTNRAFLRGLRQSAIFSEPDQKRVYPNGTLAAQVIGFPSTVESKVEGHLVSQIVGRDGIEFQMQKQLSGVAGWKITETDRQQHELVPYRDENVQARDGLNVVLTIDSAIQNIVETALVEAMQKHTPKGITGIVMRPRTGEILAMASLPNYNPNDLNTVSTNGRNRVIADVMEPGSTFKIVVVSGALNSGVVKLTDEFYCEDGHFAFAGRILHDHEAYKNLTTEGIIMKSSNIGAAKIGIKLGDQALYDYAWRYGFSQFTDIALPGETRGYVYPVKKWSKVSIAQIPMGHGIAVTRLQMIMAMGAIANNGWLMHPMIVNSLQTRNGTVVERYAPERMRQVVSDDTCRQMIQALETVVSKEGTAPDAALKNYQVAGKTGTAQKVVDRVYAPGKFVSSFIGFFPANDPQLCISVVMDEPKEGYYGGKVCGPVFRDIAERCASYLNIPPDPTMTTNVTNVPSVMAASLRKN